MLEKLLSLLLALLLLTAPALAESPIFSRLYIEKLLSAVCTALDAEELNYEKDEEYDGCFFAVDLTTPSALGDEIYYDVYAYDDGVSIIAYFENEVPAGSRDELIRLCNHFSSSIYLGKFYVDAYYDTLTYELFIPMDPRDVRSFDLELIGEYVWMAASMLDYYQEYFLLVIDGSETAANVFAMWEADNQ
ncbi:MAG: YbjN domain-containing protein [Clostridia bacterium]|nr:YbjN domain-containing protein [Clostridia bacterium]